MTISILGDTGLSYTGASSVITYLPEAAVGDLLVLVVGSKASAYNLSVVASCATTPVTLVDSLKGSYYGTTLGADTGDTTIALYKHVVVTPNSSYASRSVSLTNNNSTWLKWFRIRSSTGSVIDVTTTTKDVTSTTSNFTIHFDGLALEQKINDLCLFAFSIPTDVGNGSGFSAEYIYKNGDTQNSTSTVTEVFEPFSANNDDVGGLLCSAVIGEDYGSSTTKFDITRISGLSSNCRGPALLAKFYELIAEIEADFETVSGSIDASHIIAPGQISSAFENFSGTLDQNPPGQISGTLDYFNASISGTWTAPTDGSIGASFSEFTGTLNAGAAISTSLYTFSGTLYAGPTVSGSFISFSGAMYSGFIGLPDAPELVNRFVSRSGYVWLDARAELIDLHLGIDANFFSFTGVMNAGATIQDEFQLWNGTVGGDIVSITANIAEFECEIVGWYAFNSILANLPKFTSSIYAGANITDSFEVIKDCDMECTVGQLLGLKAYFAKWSGVSYAGGRSTTPIPELAAFDGTITGTVSHVNRLVANISLFTCEIEAYNAGAGSIEAKLAPFNSSLSGQIKNPAVIKGSFELFSASGLSKQTSRTELLGSFLKFSGVLSARDTTPGTITGDIELFDGSFYRSFNCILEAQRLTNTVKFTEDMHL